MTEPLVTAPEPIQVTVTVAGQRLPGFVTAWRGDRVYARWTAGIGLGHLGWLPAEAVERELAGSPDG